ncbi:MAG: fatty acid desaturase [Phycisphaeraceae bacterium]|nr:fatty acid desaturase [Phycisphaeraceae bacterium]MCB9848373.1 fatty acid desaturase [Phycisphaeraceae bacterium]
MTTIPSSPIDRPAPLADGVGVTPSIIPYESIRVPLRMRIANLIAIILPFAGIVAGGVLIWPLGFGWLYIALLVGGYLCTGIGVTAGFHRLFTHKSFETGRGVKFILGVLGSMAVEGPLLSWVATHRCHHQHSDRDDDPHSPHSFGGGLWRMLRGIWHAQMGWIISHKSPSFKKYVPDLEHDRMLRFIHAAFPLWVAVGLLIPALLGGLITLSWTGALLGFIWGGLIRVFFVHHVTWSVNSVCHIWGAQPYDCHDESRNNPIFGVLALGEGWHNNHHAFPTSARHGLKWWQFDASWLFIRTLMLLNLARNPRLPSKDRQISALRAG